MDRARRGSRCLALAIGAVVALGLSSAPAAAQSFSLEETCSNNGDVLLRNLSNDTISVRLYVVFSEYKSANSGCDLTNGGLVQINSHVESNIQPPEVRLMSYSSLGFTIPQHTSCTVFSVTVRGQRIDTGETVTSYCESPAMVSAIQAIPPRLKVATTVSQLYGVNMIDVAGIGGTTSCLGGLEYTTQVLNTNQDDVRVTLDGKYQCTDATGAVCTSSVAPLGAGSNRTVATNLALHETDFQALSYTNGSGGTSLPSCCESASAVVQCFTYVATQQVNTAPHSLAEVFLPSEITVVAPSAEGGGSTSCDFGTVNNVGALRSASFCDPDFDGRPGGSNCGFWCNGCDASTCDTCPNTFDSTFVDTDGDGVYDTCDNCPTVYNPGQADTDHDGIGDACDNSGGCERCIAPAGFCADVDLGTPCGKPSCGGTCKVCNGTIDCFK